MAETRIGLDKVRDDFAGERFVILIKDPARKAGRPLDTIPDLTEADVRKWLMQLGQTEGFADVLLVDARARFQRR